MGFLCLECNDLLLLKVPNKTTAYLQRLYLLVLLSGCTGTGSHNLKKERYHLAHGFRRFSTRLTCSKVDRNLMVQQQGGVKLLSSWLPRAAQRGSSARWKWMWCHTSCPKPHSHGPARHTQELPLLMRLIQRNCCGMPLVCIFT